MTPNYTPITYQCNSPIPTAQFMMYNPPPPPPPMIQPYQAALNSPNPYNFNNNGQVTPNNKFQGNNTHKHNNRNKFNNNNKRNGFNNQNQKYSYPEQTPQATYQQLEEHQFMNSPVMPQMPTYDQSPEFINPNPIIDNTHTDTQMPIYPTSSYCDPSMPTPNSDTTYQNNVESYGDEFVDTYDDTNDDDANDENLACQVCRGRRMCFCYFLKVRYYKFPSFFDLVDHQYKKWRKNMAYNNSLMQQQQRQAGQQAAQASFHHMNSPAQMNSPQPQMNASINK